MQVTFFFITIGTKIHPYLAETSLCQVTRHITSSREGTFLYNLRCSLSACSKMTGLMGIFREEKRDNVHSSQNEKYNSGNPREICKLARNWIPAAMARERCCRFLCRAREPWVHNRSKLESVWQSLSIAKCSFFLRMVAFPATGNKL